MNWFFLIFILKVLSLIHGAPIEVVDHNDNLPADSEILQNIIRQGFVVTDAANNLKKSSSKDSQKHSFNDNPEATTILVRVDETPEEFLQRRTKPVLNTVNSVVKQSNEKFSEGLKFLETFGNNKNSEINETEKITESKSSQALNENSSFHQNSDDVQNSNLNEHDFETTTTSLNLGQNVEESSESLFGTIDSTVKKSVNTLNEGFKYFHQITTDSQNSSNNENNETASTTPSTNMTQNAQASSESLSGSINSTVQKSVETLNDGLKYFENFSIHQNSPDSQNSNNNEDIEATLGTTKSTNLNQSVEETSESTLDSINSAVQHSVDALNTGYKSLENLIFGENSSDSQSTNNNENVETTSFNTSTNLDQTAEENSKSTLDSINAKVQQSVETLNTGLKSLENFIIHENSSDSQNSNTNENIETTSTTSTGPGQTGEEISQSILDSINSTVQKSVDNINDGFKILPDIENSNTSEKNETTSTTPTNLGQTVEEISVSTLDSINSTVHKSVETINDGFKYLENLSFHQNSADSQNSNTNENIETTSTSSTNLDQTAKEISESTLVALNSTVQKYVENINDGFKYLENFSFHQNSSDSHNSNNIENKTTTTSINQGPTAEESSDSTLDAINSTVQKSVDNINDGFKSLENLFTQENSSDSQNSNTNENSETTSTPSSTNLGQISGENSKSMSNSINSAVQQSVETLNKGYKSLENLFTQKNLTDSQNSNANENIETTSTTTATNLDPTSEKTSESTLDSINSAVLQSVDILSSGFKSLENLFFNKNSSDYENSNNKENFETTSTTPTTTSEHSLESILNSGNSASVKESFQSSETLIRQEDSSDSQNSNLNKNIETTPTTLNNLDQIADESSESKKALEFINSSEQESVDDFNKGLKYLESLRFNQNSADSENLNFYGNIEPTTTSEDLDETQKESSETKETSGSIHSTLKESISTLDEGLKTLENFRFQQNSDQNSNIDENGETTFANQEHNPEEGSESKQTFVTIYSPDQQSVKLFSDGNLETTTSTTLANLGQTSDESAESKHTLTSINTAVKESVNTFTDGFKSLGNLVFQQNSADSQNSNVNEDVETTTNSANLDQITEVTPESKFLENINSAVKESVDILNKGFKSIDNYGFQQNSADSQHFNINENSETIINLANLDQLPEERAAPKFLENVSSAVKESVNSLKEGINYTFQQDSTESQKPNNDYNETATAIMEQTPKETKESEILDSIISTVDQSVNTANKGIIALKNVATNRNSEDSQNLSLNETVEIPNTTENLKDNSKTLENINAAVKQSAESVIEGFNVLKNVAADNIHELETKENVYIKTSTNEDSPLKTLETTNSAAKLSNDIFNEGVISLKKFDYIQPLKNSQNSHTEENVESVTTLANPDLTAEESSISETIDTNNSAKNLSEQNINFKTLQNFGFHLNPADSQNSNLSEKGETATTSTLIDQIHTESENSESKHLIDTISSGVNSAVDSFNKGFDALKNFNSYNNSEQSQYGEITTTSENLKEKDAQSSEPKIFETINSEVKQIGENLNESLSSLGSFDVNKSSENSQNFDNGEIKKTTTTSSSNTEENSAESLDSKISRTLDSVVTLSVDTVNDKLNALKNFSFTKNSEDSQNLDTNTEQISKESSEFKSTLNNSINVLNSTVTASVENFNQGLNKLENLSANTNSEHSRNLNINIEASQDIADQKPELTSDPKTDLKQSSDFINNTLNQSAVIFNEGVKVLENFTKAEDSTTDSKPTVEEVEVANVKEIFPTTQTPIIDLFDRFNQVPVNVNEYLLKQKEETTENLTPNFEHTSGNNSELTAEEEKLIENLRENQSKASENVASSVEATTLQEPSEEIQDQTTALNSAMDLLNSGVILMKSTLNRENSSSTDTTDNILTTTSAPILNLFESLCLVPKDVPNANSNENATPVYEELKQNVEKILNRTIEDKSSETGDYIEEILADPNSSEETKKMLNEMKKMLTTTETPTLNLFESLCLVPKDVPKSINNENVTPAYEEIKHDVEEILNHTIEEKSSEPGDFIEEIPAEENKEKLKINQTLIKETRQIINEMQEILSTTEAPVLNLFESLCLVPKDVPKSDNDNVTPAYEELKHNVEEILNRTVEEKSSESGDFIEEISADEDKAEKVFNKMKEMLTSTEAPMLNLFESLCLVPKDIPKSSNNNEENVTPSYKELKHNVEEILSKNSESGQAIVSLIEEEKSSDSGNYIEKIPAELSNSEEAKMSNSLTTEDSTKAMEEGFSKVDPNTESYKIVEFSAPKTIYENINQNREESQILSSNYSDNKEQTERLGESLNQTFEDAQHIKKEKTAEELSSVNVKDEGEKMENIFITSQAPIEVLTENFSQISEDSNHSNTVVNENEPEVGQDILQIAAKLIEEEEKIMDLNEHEETKNLGQQNELTSTTEVENLKTEVGKSEAFTSAENIRENKQNSEQSFEQISVNSENIQPRLQLASRNIEGGHSVENVHEEVTERSTNSYESVPNLSETVREITKESSTTTEILNNSEDPKTDSLTADRKSQEVKEELSAAVIKLDDFTSTGTEINLKDSTIFETNTNKQESVTRSNSNQMEVSTLESTSSETIKNSNEFTTNPSINTDETTYNMPSKFEEELNMAVKNLEATTHQHFEQFQQNLKKAFKSFTEWEAEHMKQEATTTSDHMMTTMPSISEDKITTLTTHQTPTHKELDESTSFTTMRPLEETTLETTSESTNTEVPVEIPNIGVINEVFVDKYQENVQDNLKKTKVSTSTSTLTKFEEESSTSSPFTILNSEDENVPRTIKNSIESLIQIAEESSTLAPFTIINSDGENIPKTTMPSIESLTKIVEQSSTSAPLLLHKSEDENIPETTMTPDILTTMKATLEDGKSYQVELAQLHVLEATASADMTTIENDKSEVHSTAVTSDHNESTTSTQNSNTENAGETTIVPLFARVQLQKDVNSVSLIKYDNDSSEKEIVKEQFENTNTATESHNKTTHQEQSDKEYVEKAHQTNEHNYDQITTHNPSEETTQFIRQTEKILPLSTTETISQDMVTFIQQHQDTSTYKQDDESSQTQLPLTQASFMEEQQQQLESTTETNVQTPTTATGEHDIKTEITTSNDSITPTTEPEVYSTFIVEAETETTNTTPSPLQIDPETRSRALPPPKLEYLQNEDGVEVFYGYSIVKRN